MPWEIERLIRRDGAGWWLKRMQQHWAIRADVEAAERKQAASGGGDGGWQSGS